MKKPLSLVLLLTLIFSATACSSNGNTSDVETTLQTTAATETTAAVTISFETKEDFDNTLDMYDFEGIVYITQNGNVIYQSATGSIEDQMALTIDTPMPIGSVSKQFCAAAILILRDQGKLSVDDKLSKYFPEYEIGKDITLKNLLSMRSGIADMVEDGEVEELSANNSEAVNTEAIMNWIFSQPLKFDPDSELSYSNSNYFLLGNIVEQVSGQKYIDFIRENIFEPLGMNHSGSIEEVKDSPDWANGVQFYSAEDGLTAGLTKGAGDIVSNAPDMDAWMTGLRSGKIISLDSYKEMTTDHSPDYSPQYGYGLSLGIYEGIGHTGAIGTYSACDYFNEEQDFNLFIASNNISTQIDSLSIDLITDILA